MELRIRPDLHDAELCCEYFHPARNLCHMALIVCSFVGGALSPL